MCFNKKSKQLKKFKLSIDAIEFIKKYLLSECNVTSKIDENIIEDFLSISFDWETLTVDEYGKDKNYDYPNKERNEMADRFVSEVSGKWTSGCWTIDFDDLNNKLGLE